MKQDLSWKTVLQGFLRLGIGATFCYSGWVKLGKPQAFADSIAAFQMLPSGLENLLALSLPTFEIIVGLLLILGLGLPIASLSVVLMTTVFAFALGQALARGLVVDCGCFGTGTPSTAKMWQGLGLDLLLWMASMVVYFNPSSAENTKPESIPPDS